MYRLKNSWGTMISLNILSTSKATLQRSSSEKVFWKYAANLLENTQAKVWFQISCLRNFIEIALLHGCSPVNLLHICCRTSSLKVTSGGFNLIHYTWQKGWRRKWSRNHRKGNDANRFFILWFSLKQQTEWLEL